MSPITRHGAPSRAATLHTVLFPRMAKLLKDIRVHGNSTDSPVIRPEAGWTPSSARDIVGSHALLARARGYTFSHTFTWHA